MDFTPILNEDSGCVPSFDSSSSMFVSTPKLGPTIARKRKLAALTPQFSSTLNESLLDDLGHLDIEGAIVPSKQSRSTPCTPDKRLGELLSPIKEAREILCSSLKPVPLVKKSTPQKAFTPCKKCLFKVQDKGPTQLLFEVLSNDIIMRNIFKFLSNGDLYRFSNVCKNFQGAVLNDFNARLRYENFKEIYKLNKENYVITPKNSPERPDNNNSYGDNRNFYNYVNLIPFLKPEQTLNKCPSCGSVSIVENNISQCQNISNCGYICCKLCQSFSSTGPEDFHDKCQNAKLQPLQNNSKSRNKLEDLSNHDSFFTILNVTNKVIDSSSSGFYSDQSMESVSPTSVKRNLFGSNNNNNSDKLKILSANNDSSVKKSKKVFKESKKKRISFVPVVKCEKGSDSAIQCSSSSPSSSPIRKNCGIGSKQSKKNLKRLTF